MTNQYTLNSPKDQGVINGPSKKTLRSILAYSKALEVKTTSIKQALLVLN